MQTNKTGCLCAEIDPSDRPCLTCEARTCLKDFEEGRRELSQEEAAFARVMAERP